VQRRIGIFGIGLELIVRVSSSRLGSAAGWLASTLSPSEPVMSDGMEVWQPATPKASVAAVATPTTSLAAESRWNTFCNIYP